MIKNLILIILVILLAWVTKDYFSITLPSNDPIPYKKELHQVHPEKTIKPAQNSAKVQTPIKESELTLEEMLEQGLFYDALAYYLENTTQDHMKQIEYYLALLANKKPLLALEYMQVFLENEPESNVLKLMIKTYIAQDDLPKAIELLIGARENCSSEIEDKILASQLKDVAIKHMDALMHRGEYAELISFLEEMIAYDSTDNYYKFRLAKLYMKLDKMDQAGVLLDVIQYDEVYAQNVQSLLNVIEQEEQESYDYAIPLQNYGSHYVASISLDGNLFNLMLDTGATYIFVDEDKASMIEVIRDDLTMQTAGNDISAKIGNVSSLRAGNLELSNIQVTMAPFKREGIDGLLGMNFFRQFKFYINQEESVLYLNPK